MDEAGKNPTIIWHHKCKDGEYRVVQTGRGKFSPEKRGPDDAMMQPAWSMTMWGQGWQQQFIDDLLGRGVEAAGGKG